MLAKNINDIIDECECVTIVAATKYQEAPILKELLKVGINNFGENRVDDFLVKYDYFKDEDIVWHFIGHLQTNKVQKMINKIDYLHSLDSIHLAKYIEKYRVEKLDTFIEVKFTLDTNKYGVYYEDLKDFINELKKYPTINVVGLMYMNEENYSKEEKLNNFKHLVKLKEELNLPYVSAGMSNDYKLAIKAKTDFVRLGRILWEG